MRQISRRARTLGIAVATAIVMAATPAAAQSIAPGADRQTPTAPALVDVTEATTDGAPGDQALAAEVNTSLLDPGVARTVSVDVVGTNLEVDLEPMVSGAPGWAAWGGTVAGEPESTATVVRKGDDVAAIFTTPDGSYRIRTTAAGTQEVQAVTQDFPEATDDAPTPPATLDLGLPTDPGTTDGNAPADPPATEGDVPINAVIDVLVATTPGSRAEAGSTSAMNAEIALAISTTNTAFINSGVAGRVRLAGTTALTEDFELASDSDDPDIIGLSKLTDPADGHSDQIHATRNAVGADLVSVLTADPSFCGRAWLLTNTSSAAQRSAYGFSIVNYGCASSNLSFAHELGHNMGLNHDRYVADTALYPYAFGYVNVAAQWRTIMAYNNECQDNFVSCTRLGRFSNPNQTYLGAPLGRPSTGSAPADNAKALNNSQAFVASWRAKPAPFTSWTKFVSQQYRDFLGRAPSGSESSAGVNALNTGVTTPEAYVDGLLKGSYGATYAPIARLYFAYFLRSPDVGGLDYWVRRNRGGQSLTSISSNFAASSEFINKYGPLSNRAFVNQIYVNLFNRTGDASGVNYWTGKLDARTKTRGQVMVGFSESSEFKRVRAEEIDVVLIYRALLARGATASEFASQVARLQGGVTVRRLILELIDSAGYASRVTK